LTISAVVFAAKKLTNIMIGNAARFVQIKSEAH